MSKKKRKRWHQGNDAGGPPAGRPPVPAPGAAPPPPPGPPPSAMTMLFRATLETDLPPAPLPTYAPSPTGEGRSARVFTDADKECFLKLFCRMGRFQACQYMSVRYSKFQDFLREDPEFAEAVDQINAIKYEETKEYGLRKHAFAGAKDSWKAADAWLRDEARVKAAAAVHAKAAADRAALESTGGEAVGRLVSELLQVFLPFIPSGKTADCLHAVEAWLVARGVPAADDADTAYLESEMTAGL